MVPFSFEEICEMYMCLNVVELEKKYILKKLAKLSEHPKYDKT